MFQKIKNHRLTKIIAIYLVFSMIANFFPVNRVFALTGGPSQPEVQSFEPIGTTEMVDPFSGDFTYNLPLLDVGGYPINLSYHSGITMDQEASWVGLGWNINPGVILRNMRAIPDDFNGETVKKEFNVKSNETYGMTFMPQGELFGINLGNLGFNLGLSYNNYRGVGFDVGVNPSISAGDPNKSSLTMGLGLSAGTSGVGISPSVSFSTSIEDKKKNDVGLGGKIGLPFNSRGGMQSLSIDANVEKTFTNKKIVKGEHKGKKTNVTKSFNGGASISFAGSTYTPQISMPMINTSVSVSGTLGGELFGAHANMSLKGYYSGQFLLKKTEDVPAYGYMYAQNVPSDNEERVMLDFNREKDGSFTKDVPNLPLTNFTYDVYSVSGQGIGGMYRPFRSDIGYVYDCETKNISGGFNLGGIEIGVGNAAHGVINVSLNESNARSGKWRNSGIESVLQFKGSEAGNPLYEPYYFKQAGEKTAETDAGFLAGIGGYEPVRLQIDESSADTKLSTAFVTKDQASSISITDNTRDSRQRRNESIFILNATDAKDHALVKEIEVYDEGSFTFNSDYSIAHNASTSFERDVHPGHHISEISAYRPDGARYIYGIPAYNYTKEDVSFAITGGNPDHGDGLVSYAHGYDNTKDNTKGLDNYFSKTTVPEYAHSYLLTAVLSPNYVDVDDNGPSDNDLGGYTKINYSRVSDYKWRVPFEESKANYSEGLKSIDNLNPRGDDKASYIYGEKELWYVHSIETKTHVALFYTSDREDAQGVVSDKGGMDTKSMKKLDKIVLYSKADIREQGGDLSSATPVKTVHFEYDYSLCGNLPNNTGDAIDVNGDDPSVSGLSDVNTAQGKLTLKKLYFTYGKSMRGKLSSYTFDYGKMYVDQDGVDPLEEIEINPGYNLKGYDRWGNFNPNPVYGDGTLYAAEYPYVCQAYVPEDADNVYFDNNFQSGTGSNELFDLQNSERKMADVFAYAWNLTDIDLPSGGHININYEADDYAYVQDKRATEMFKVVAASNALPTTPSGDGNALYGTNGLNSNSYLIVKLDNTYPTGTSDDVFKEDYLAEEDGTTMKLLYFRFLVNLESSILTPAYEYVSGYAELDYDNCGFIDQGSDITYAYVKVDEIDINDGVVKSPQVNPIAQAAWNFTRLHLPRIAYNQPDVTEPGLIQIFQGLAATFTSMKQFAKGFNHSLRGEGHAKYFDDERSWLRLCQPDGMKKGGGARVKYVTLSDEWKEMTGESSYTTAEYGQEYIYETTNAYGKTISSGVAAYEPQVGGDENPFKTPIYIEKKNLLVPDDDYYIERPIGEDFFPGASVGYSKVIVKNIEHANVSRHATGKVEHLFYTAKDFPVIVDQTEVYPVHSKSNPVFKLLQIKTRDFMTASQGYVIELNDMHGKPKGQRVYQQGKSEPISGVDYKYKVDDKGRLDNDVLTITKGGVIDTETIGVDYDFIVDLREHNNTSRSAGLGGNLDAFMAALLPIVVPVVLPSYSEEEVWFKSAVTTKVVNRYGLVDEVIAYDLGSSVSTSNMMYDAETGEVLLTETFNNFKDPVYSLTYPAHWGYDGMGPAYKNLGFKMEVPDDPSSIKQYLVEGDEIIIEDDPERYWVVQVEGKIVIKDRSGTIIDLGSKSGQMTIVRSGSRNMQSTPIASVVLFDNPLYDKDNDGDYDELKFSKVINASATTYINQAGTICECDFQAGDQYNPYITGKKNGWRVDKSYVYLTDRVQSRSNDNTNIRDDGVYETYTPFWTPNSGYDWNTNDDQWTYASEVSLYSPNGVELENKDALDRYSAAVYGYGNTLPVSVSGNSRYRDVAVDNFEDYDFTDCDDDHFSYKLYKAYLTEDESHTGRKSIMLDAGDRISIEKTIIPCK